MAMRDDERARMNPSAAQEWANRQVIGLTQGAIPNAPAGGDERARMNPSAAQNFANQQIVNLAQGAANVADTYLGGAGARQAISGLRAAANRVASDAAATRNYVPPRRAFEGPPQNVAGSLSGAGSVTPSRRVPEGFPQNMALRSPREAGIVSNVAPAAATPTTFTPPLTDLTPPAAPASALSQTSPRGMELIQGSERVFIPFDGSGVQLLDFGRPGAGPGAVDRFNARVGAYRALRGQVPLEQATAEKNIADAALTRETLPGARGLQETEAAVNAARANALRYLKVPQTVNTGQTNALGEPVYASGTELLEITPQGGLRQARPQVRSSAPVTAKQLYDSLPAGTQSVVRKYFGDNDNVTEEEAIAYMNSLTR